ncbi:MAG: hypothetical protein Q8K32_09335 [Archangium sp.]|nr:hypothetical protein [Archangium sp.]
MAAVVTEAEVCNMALGLIGQRQFIDRLDAKSTEAQVCKRFYASTRNELLEAWHWRFATKRAVLPLAANGAGELVTRSGWGFSYVAPADLLKARRIWDGDRASGAGSRIPFTKELNDDATGHLILTDHPEAELVYTVELRTVALWTSKFTMAVAKQLAVYLATCLPVKAELARLLQPEARLALQTAAASDANEAEPDPETDSEWIRERG